MMITKPDKPAFATPNGANLKRLAGHYNRIINTIPLIFKQKYCYIFAVLASFQTSPAIFGNPSHADSRGPIND